MRRSLRLTLIGIAAFLAALVLAVVVALYVMLQPQRFTDLLRAQVREAGLNLALSAPASPTLWPQPAVVLQGLTLTANNRPVLVAVRARLVLPWRTLLGGPPAITRLELDTPRINLSQLGPVLAHMQHGGAGPPVMPHVDAGIRISHGSMVRGDELLLGDIRLDTGPLTPGRVFNLQLTAHTAHGHPATLTLALTPHADATSIRFDAIHVVANGPSGLDGVLGGHATWGGGTQLAMSLVGQFTHGDAHRYDLALTLVPATGTQPFLFRIKVGGPGLDANVQLSPAQLMAWWRTVSATSASADIPLPPLTATVDARTLTLGATHIEGLHLSTSVPAAAASAPAAASTRP